MTKVKFDGYVFGDRILEGVWFTADVDGQKVTNVKIAPESDGDYWRGLSKTKWLGEAKRYISGVIEDLGLQGAIENEYCELI